MFETTHRNLTIAMALLTAGLLTGCSAPVVDVKARQYDVSVALDPTSHQLEATATVVVERLGAAAPTAGNAVFKLHPELELTAVRVDGAEVSASRKPGERDPEDEDDTSIVPDRVLVPLPKATEPVEITFTYAGPLFQDVAAGEKAGQVHNFAMAAHVGEDGIFLVPSGYWYPMIDFDDDVVAETWLADFALTLRDVPEGFEVVAGLQRVDDGNASERRYESAFATEGLVLLGGPLVRHSRLHSRASGEVMLHTLLAPGKDDVAQDILDASAELLDRYEPLVGPYPFTEFTLAEAFFSSGFAFPGCTQIVGSQLTAFKQYRRHGYLDHELLHNWWGNGIYYDGDDGNWVEALTSWSTNLYGHVLDGDPVGARKIRRNDSNFLSALKPEDDKPLSTFGQEEGAGRGIGYQKGAMVFHMLQRKIGDEAMFAALRDLTANFMGGYAGWDDLQAAFEAESGQDLDAFFEQWVHGTGSPQLRLVEAQQTEDGQLHVTLSQEGTAFELDVPLRLYLPDGTSQDVAAAIDEERATVTLDVDGDVAAIELDPDYQLFRRLRPDEIMPTSIMTRRSEAKQVLVASDELWEGYATVRDAYLDEDEGEQAVLADAFDPTAPAALVVVGDAVRDARVAEILNRSRSGVVFDEAGFSVDGQRFDGAGHAIYFTVHHPDAAGTGITVYFGNSEEALSNAAILDFYPNSLLVFETPEGATPSADGMPHAKVVLRKDFEFPDRLEL